LIQGPEGFIVPPVDPHAIKVIIRNSDGRYLAHSGPEWVFTAEPAEAQVFDFIQDEVAARVEAARMKGGMDWTVVRADPRAGFETCDRCGRRVMAFKAVFDGQSFLCATCLEGSSDSIPTMPGSSDA